MKKKLVILSGAGMSAESGLSTFRDQDGLWEKYRVEDVCTPEAWYRNPQLVLDFYNQRRRDLYNAIPNNGHKIIAKLEKDFNVTVITQNVDNLHERAGSTDVVHLHGELTKVRSSRYENLIYDVDPKNPDTKIGDKCEKGFQLRPHIVFFGEAVPMIETAAEIVSKADILVIIGTSMNVYPAAGLIHYARKGIKIYLIDPNDVNIPAGINVEHIKKGASLGMKELEEKIEKDK
ncbi:MAG: NAD-dependent deacylase [Bacteroidales bacterium]|nr:NAD-dependent deacylase [Bacteroidales bacterium]